MNRDNRRIAINTGVLYVKLIVVIIVSFVSTRLVLKALGASDYGLYNVVGAMVAMINTIGTSMVATSYRYMAVEIGKGPEGNPNRVYNTIMVIHIAIAILFLIAGETLGVWYVEHHMNIPPAHTGDALFILHLSLLTTALAVVTIPINGLLVAQEDFGYISLTEIASALVKIGLIVVLLYIGSERLRWYAVFMAIFQVMQSVMYQIYGRCKYSSLIRWHFNSCLNDYKEVIVFAWWILLGAIAVIGQVQGAAVIMNVFFGTVVNAAFGIATQIRSVVIQFTTTLRQAAVPQIMKSMASDSERSINLVYAISRYTFLCMLMISLPLIFRMDEVLRLWLENVPQYTGIFIIYMLLCGLVTSLAGGFDASIQASGNLRKNQIGYAVINLLLLPIMYVAYRLGYPPYANVIIMLILGVASVAYQCYIMAGLTGFTFPQYTTRTILPCLKAGTISAGLLWILNMVMPEGPAATLGFLACGVLLTAFTVVFAGLRDTEQAIIRNMINGK